MKNLNRLLYHPISHIIALTALIWLVFARTLGSYFLADDFGEIFYASRIFSGEYNLLWSDFTSNFMQVAGMAVWRPWLMVSLFLDFCIWRANPVGYYLTNLLSYNTVVILFYIFVYSLTAGVKETKGRLVALLSAALFAVSPLHCESVSWVVGRVDVVCAVFYLACLNLSLYSEQLLKRNQNAAYKMATAGAVICFWLGMWTKEMAIGAPIMVTTMFLLFGQRPLNLKYSLKLAAPLWLSMAIYFALRYLVLGTLLGGYVQGIGDSQAANALTRWLDPDTIHRLFFPFAQGIFGNYFWQQTALQIVYAVMLTLIGIRAATTSLSLRWVAFLTVWLLTCLAPLYKLWGIGFELEGARFCFFLTLPLSLAAPALIIMDAEKRKPPFTVSNTLKALGATASLCEIIILGKAAFLNNLEWVHAGHEVRSVARQAQQLAEQAAGSSRKILVLGIPKRRGGAHMILNGATFTTALRPPFTENDYSAPFITFDPVQFAESPYINSDRFKKLVSQGDKVMVWHSPSRSFHEVRYTPLTNSGERTTLPPLPKEKTAYIHKLGCVNTSVGSHHSILLNNITDGDCLAFSNLKLNPLTADYIEVEFRTLDQEKAPIRMRASTNDQIPGYYHSTESKDSILRVPLSRDWHWYSQSKVDSLFLLLPPGRQIELTGYRLVRTEEVAPIIEIMKGQNSYEGVIELAPNTDGEISLSVTFPSLPGIVKLQVEISKPNTFFENFRENQGAAAIMSKKDFALRPDFSKTPSTTLLALPNDKLLRGSYYQLRARLLDNAGKTLGELSNPITVLLNSTKKD